jgi:DNA-binding transcriptional ArsR family regulator
MNRKLGLLFPSFLSAVGHPVRQEILLILREGGLAVGVIVKKMQLSQATVSHHLAILKKAGVVKACREGRKIIYCIDCGMVCACCANLQRTLAS